MITSTRMVNIIRVEDFNKEPGIKVLLLLNMLDDKCK